MKISYRPHFFDYLKSKNGSKYKIEGHLGRLHSFREFLNSARFPPTIIHNQYPRASLLFLSFPVTWTLLT